MTLNGKKRRKRPIVGKEHTLFIALKNNNMKNLIIAVLTVVLTLPVAAQDTDIFYSQCFNEIVALKAKWPSTQNWKGDTVLTPSYEVDKKEQMRLAEEFMKTQLYRAACAQSDIAIGKMHQTDNKIIKSRTIGSMTITAHVHADEYNIHLAKDFKTKKWKLEFTYTHHTYSTPPATNVVDINIDGSQQLAGAKNQSAYCVIASIALHRDGKNTSGFEASDSSAERPCQSANNSDLGKISSWDR